MIITEIKKKGTSENYHVYVDDKYYCLMAYDYIYKYKLKQGMEISEEKLRQIKKESDDLICSSIALNYISKKFCCEYDLRAYLKKYGFISDSINLAINKLKEYNYINDDVWAQNIVSGLKANHGNLYIKQKLEQKGLSDEIISKVIDENDESDSCLIQAKKWIKIHKIPENINEKNKLYSFLLRKGFSYDAVKQALNKINNNLGDDDGWN